MLATVMLVNNGNNVGLIVILIMAIELILVCFFGFVPFVDCNFRELFDDVKHNVQSATSSAAYHEDEDRLEQDYCVQNWR